MSSKSVIIDYSRKADAELDDFAELVYKALNPNLNFTWGTEVMPQFKTNCDNYRARLIAAASGSTADITAKNVAKAVLVENLHDIAVEVNRQADGDIIKLLSSALTLTKEREKVGTLPKPSRLKVTTGPNPGEATCTVPSNRKASMYNFYIAATPAPESIDMWRLVTSSRCTKKISGLKAGVQYTVRAAYQGASEEIIYSDPVFFYAQ
jgi:hypothetical protein